MNSIRDGVHALHAECFAIGHAYADWVESRPVLTYLGQKCSRCGATFPGATCKPAELVKP